MLINRILIKNKYNLLSRIKDKNFALFFFNIKNVLIGIYHN